MNVAMMAPRRTLFCGLAFVSLFSIASFIFFHLQFSSLPGFTLPSYSKPSTGPRELSLKLHPEAHNNREPQILHHHWNVSQELRAPDGVQKRVYLINDRFPGPTIEARSGDTLIIEVLNSLQDEGFAIHWHGLRMKGANSMDGVVGATQNEVRPGEQFTYEFKIDENQSGTFWYHSHHATQRADGLYGGLIVHKPGEHTDKYESDNLLMIGDWYHRPAEEVRASYVHHDSWGREPVPDSLAINGMGSFNCSMAVASRPLECTDLSSPRLTLGAGKSRLRIINVGSMSGMTLTLPNQRLTLLSVDGGNEIADRASTSSLGILYPGERIDVVAEWASSDDHSQLIVNLDEENYDLKNKALTSVQTFPIWRSVDLEKSKRGHPFRPTPITHSNDFIDLSTLNGSALTPDVASEKGRRSIVVYTKMEVLAHLGNVPAGFINRTSWAPQSSPPQPLIALDREEFDRNQLVPLVQVPQQDSSTTWVDIVVNNLDEKGHPFHLHGYDFFVLQSFKPSTRGYHAYNPFSDVPPKGGPYNLANPIKKDTVYVPSQGYVVLRIKADNEGIWFFHCHVLWHGVTGMAMALQVEYV